MANGLRPWTPRGPTRDGALVNLAVNVMLGVLMGVLLTLITELAFMKLL